LPKKYMARQILGKRRHLRREHKSEESEGKKNWDVYELGGGGCKRGGGKKTRPERGVFKKKGKKCQMHQLNEHPYMQKKRGGKNGTKDSLENGMLGG